MKRKQRVRYGEIDRERERQRERKQIRGLRGRREEDEKVGEEGDRLGASDRARPMIDRPTVRYQ